MEKYLFRRVLLIVPKVR